MEEHGIVVSQVGSELPANICCVTPAKGLRSLSEGPSKTRISMSGILTSAGFSLCSVPFHLACCMTVLKVPFHQSIPPGHLEEILRARSSPEEGTGWRSWLEICCHWGLCALTQHCTGCLTVPVVLQVFFHDPDYNMIEICNCDNLPKELLSEKCQLSRACTMPLTALPACKSGVNAHMHFDASTMRPLQ